MPENQTRQNPLSSAFRRTIKDPEGNTAGLAVRHDPEAGPHQTEFTVEQLWPDGEAEPIYVGDIDDALHLLQGLSEVIRRAQR